MEVISEHASFGGTQGFYRHASNTIGLPMRFSVFVPPQARNGPVPVLFYLAGLTCTEETFPTKAAAQAHAAQHGIMLVASDTSPRGSGEEGADAAWDFGYGAGFYLDATEAPWSTHWKMESYVTGELLDLVLSQFPARADRVGIFGHSMGGHGALTLALRHPGKYISVSAFAPIAAPSQCPWGEKAFAGYLGSGRDAWSEHDATALIASGARAPHILIDQGLADKVLAEQLHPEKLEAACRVMGQPLTLRRQPGYDHGYYFVSSFMGDHIAHHARTLCA
ncbi:MAG: S-formylglutathione hydrolase [Rhizobacter sp.]|nr:S-formylglutathione hydrolase [Rhizobacter sp.]